MFGSFRDLAFLGAAAGGGELWTPAAITTALWLDAADASAVTTISGAVSQWNDKSGNTRNFTQSDSARRPTYGISTLNGKSAVGFDGSNDFLGTLSTALFSSGNANLTIIAAYKPRLAIGYGTLFGNYGAVGTGEFAIYYGSSAPYITPWGVYNQATVDISPASYVQGAETIIALRRDSGMFTGWTNGTENNTVSNSNSVYATANPSASIWRIGTNTQGGEAGFFDLYELLCVNSSISTDTRQKLEGYLAHKWGLTANLPADHPYKSAAPTI
jgi:hypothetical protein